MNDFKFSFNEPLNSEDKETQTFGCRANNPDNCANNGLIGVCAFCSEDHICRRPSKKWKNQYHKLKNLKIKDE
jgi:hypothetical protein